MGVQLPCLLFSLCICANAVQPHLVGKLLDLVNSFPSKDLKNERIHFGLEDDAVTGPERLDESMVFTVPDKDFRNTYNSNQALIPVFKMNGRRLSSEEELKLVTDNIDSLDEFFFGRYFKTEKMTCESYETAVKELEDNMANRLETYLTDIRRELDMTNDQGNPGCIEGINKRLNLIVTAEVKIFKRLSVVALSNLNLLKEDLDDKISAYEEKKNYTIAQFNNCKRKFAGNILWNKRKQCYQHKKQEFVIFAKYEAAYHSSPCMAGFQRYEMDAIIKTLTRFAEKINKELKSVTCCRDRLVSLNLNTTIFEQVNSAKNKYNDLEDDLEATMRHYYKKEVDVLNEHDLQPRTDDWFRKDLEGSLTVYSDTIEGAVWENNDAPGCGVNAVESLKNIVEKASVAYAAADKLLVEDTAQLMRQVRADFASINDELPAYGDVAILDCFANNQLIGDSIMDCYNLKYRWFLLNNNETLTRIVQTVGKLDSCNFNQLGSHTPKGKVYQKRLILKVENVLKDFEKCIYNSTGRRYAVKVRPESSTVSIRKVLPTKLLPTTTSNILIM